MLKFFKNIILAALLLTASQGCKNADSEPEQQEEAPKVAAEEVIFTAEQCKMAAIQVAPLIKKDMSLTVRANGTMDVPPYSIASIHAPLGGFVKKSELLPGDYVEQGEVLALLEHPDYIRLQQSYLETSSQAELARKDYERQKLLAAQEVNAAQKLEKAESAWQVARVQQQGLEAQLRLLGLSGKQLEKSGITNQVAIRAPFRGYITAVNVNIGKYVSPVEVMYELINKEHLHVELQVFEKDIFKVREGQKIAFRIPAAGTESYGAKVHLISQTFNNETKTIGVHGHLDKGNPAFKPGMFVEGEIYIENAAAEVLPEEAVVMKEGRYYCFAADSLKEGAWRFRKVEVSKGRSERGYTVVNFVSLQAAPEKLVHKGAYYIIAEMSKGEAEEE